MKVGRDTAIRAIRRLVMDIAPGADVDFFTRPGEDGTNESVQVSHHDAQIRRVVSEIAVSVLAQVGYPVPGSSAPISELVSLRDQARQQWMAENSEGLADMRFHDVFRRVRGAVDPAMDLEP